MNQKELKKLIKYNKKTGKFTWRNKFCKKINIGDIAGGSLDSKGHIQIGLKGHNYRAQQLAFLYVKGYIPNEIDHIDHNPKNNKWENLREVSHSENMRNLPLQKNNKFKINGISLNYLSAKRYRAHIKVNSISIHLGLFDDFFEACCARKSAEYKYKFHKNHGR